MSSAINSSQHTACETEHLLTFWEEGPDIARQNGLVLRTQPDAMTGVLRMTSIEGETHLVVVLVQWPLSTPCSFLRKHGVLVQTETCQFWGPHQIVVQRRYQAPRTID